MWIDFDSSRHFETTLVSSVKNFESTPKMKKWTLMDQYQLNGFCSIIWT